MVFEIEALDQIKIRQGWTAEQKKCFELVTEKLQKWTNSKELTQETTEILAFKSALAFFTETSKQNALGLAEKSLRVSKQNEPVFSNYFRALSLSSSSKQEIAASLLAASKSKTTHAYEEVLRKRAISLLKNRISGLEVTAASKEWLKIEPNNVEIMLWAFQAAIDTKNIKEAQSLLKKLEDKNLADTEVSLASLRAEILFGLEKYSEAGVIYEKLLQEKSLSPKRRKHYLARFFETQLSQKNWKNVRSTLEKLLSGDPTNARYLKFYEQSFVEGALDQQNLIKDLQRAIEIYPESQVFKMMLASAYLKQYESPQYEDKVTLLFRAESYTSQISNMGKTSADAGYLRAKVLYYKRAFTKAENEILLAVSNTKNSSEYKTPLVEIYDLAARVLWARGLWGEARKIALEGSRRVTLREHKEILNKLRKQIPSP